MSRRAWQRIVDSYEGFDEGAIYDDNVCLYVVSKQLRGETRVEDEAKQECSGRDCVTLKRRSQYRMEIDSGPCDSTISRDVLNGMAEGQLVSAYADGDLAKRGGMSGTIRWQGAGSSIVGRSLAVLNAGTHHEPLNACEECNVPGHAEGWVRGAIVDGEHTGGRVNGAISYDFRVGQDGAEFVGTIEGLLIVQCDD